MDSDDLLAEEDLLKPDPASLRSKYGFSSLIKRKVSKYGILKNWEWA